MIDIFVCFFLELCLTAINFILLVCKMGWLKKWPVLHAVSLSFDLNDPILFPCIFYSSTCAEFVSVDFLLFWWESSYIKLWSCLTYLNLKCLCFHKVMEICMEGICLPSTSSQQNKIHMSVSMKILSEISSSWVLFLISFPDFLFILENGLLDSGYPLKCVFYLFCGWRTFTKYSR